jgi:tellurite methyltransferase
MFQPTNNKGEGNKEWWTAKYKTKDLIYGKAPSDFLSKNIELLKKGKTLDVAMGEGRNTAYLASKGFEVEGFDFCEVATERATKLCNEMGVNAEIKTQNLDFYLIPLMKYNSIIMIDYHPSPTFYSALTRGLADGGTLLVEGFTTEQVKISDGPKVEFFECFKSNELLGHIKGLKLLYYSELRQGNIAKVYCLAKKVLF